MAIINHQGVANEQAKSYLNYTNHWYFPIVGDHRVYRNDSATSQARDDATRNAHAFAHGPLVEARAKKIMQTEKAINQATLDNATAEQIHAMLAGMHKDKLYIVDTKLNCRDHLQSVLNDEQWTTLVEIYQQHNHH